MNKPSDDTKKKFRPDADAALDREIESALEGLSLDDLYQASGTQAKPAASEPGTPRGVRRGRIISIDAKKNEVFVDFGGKSQGVAPFDQFDAEPAVGQEMEFSVERYDAAEGLLILNRRGALASKVTWETLEVGQLVEGTVTGVNKGGLEVEVKSMRAFMPAGQVDIYHVPDLSQFMGQRLQAEVTQCDRSSRNLILSRRNILERQKEEDRRKLMEELAEGQTRRGTVRSIMDFGAFVDLGGVDGLIHVSEMAWRRVKNPSEVLKVGDLVDVKVLKIDKETGKLSLSLKQAMADPWLDVATKYAVGTTLTGRITRVESFGAFVEAEEGIEGLLPISEMSWQRIKQPSDVVQEGQTVKLVVISLDATARRMSFSMKQAGPDPWAKVEERYAREMIVPGTVTRLAEFGAFVELEPGLEGLVHVSELSNQRVRTPGDVVKPGQQVQVQVLEIDKEGRRISLSLKRAAEMAAMQKAPAAPATPAAAKKKKVELRGGLDFEMKKNK